MNGKTWLGLMLVAVSYAQLLIPRRMFDKPSYILFGYAFLPNNLLALAAVAFTLGVILLSEGICQRFGGVSLWRFATATPGRLLRVVLAAGACGLALELVCQWLGKLWVYPYWTTWLYELVVLPGFAFYWVAIAESYLAAKAVVDARWKGRVMRARAFPVPNRVLGFSGFACLAGAATLFVQWYAERGGYTFAVIRPVVQAPPFAYALLAFAGGWLVAEWLLRRRGIPSLVASVFDGYWGPVVALLSGSAVLSYVMETQNTIHNYWRYAHFPAPGVTVSGVPAAVFVTWPLHYVAFLLLASLLVPALAPLFWDHYRQP